MATAPRTRNNVGNIRSGGIPSGARGSARDLASRGDDPDRDRAEDSGFLGEEADPTGLRGMLSGVESFLEDLSGPPSVNRPAPTERAGLRAPNEEERLRLRPQVAEEEAPALQPGDPDNLGERGRRRRREDDDTPSPVLRRGLLGV